VLFNALFALAILHLLAALKHHFIDRDDVLKRMLLGGR
jgi:cytochrome b561